MPSPIGHVIAGVAAGWLVAGAPRLAPPVSTKVPGTFPAQVPATFWREAALFGALGALPDIDLLFGAHSGPTHSLGAMAIVGLTAFVLTRHFSTRRAGRLALACAAAYASHVLLDWLGSDASPPLGVMALWPFSHAHFESDVHVFMAISRRYYQGWVFVAQNVRAVGLELVILVPILALVWRFRLRRTVWSVQ
jgi:membrane-bound metal-dependent hydrolase YbcI (DUF457 family)